MLYFLRDYMTSLSCSALKPFKCISPSSLSTVDINCKSSRSVSEGPGRTSSPSLFIPSALLPPIYPSRLWSSRAPCWCDGWLASPCCLWNWLQATGPSSPPKLRAWGVASRGTAGTSGPTLSSSWLTTRMLNWVRLAYDTHYWYLFCVVMFMLTHFSLVFSLCVFVGICIRLM